MSKAKTKTIQDQRRDIFEAIYGVSLMGTFNKRTKKTTPNSILNLFEQDYNRFKNKGINKLLELYKNYSYAIFFGYSPSSIRNNLVAFRNVILEHGGKYQANAIQAFTVDNVYAPINKKNHEQKVELKRNVQMGTNTDIDPKVIKDKIQALKKELETKSYDVKKNQKEPQVRAYRIVALLGMATGRRFTELMKTLEIKKRGSKITFSGLLKGNDKTIDGHIIELSYKDVKKYLAELRAFAKTEDMSEQEVNAKYAKVFNNALKRLGFKNVKATRHNYSVAGSQLFKKEGESIEDTITRILGHRENFTSALNYT
jgi:hypothetical protein